MKFKKLKKLIKTIQPSQGIEALLLVGFVLWMSLGSSIRIDERESLDRWVAGNASEASTLLAPPGYVQTKIIRDKKKLCMQRVITVSEKPQTSVYTMGECESTPNKK